MIVKAGDGMLPEGQHFIGTCGEVEGTSAGCLDATYYGVAKTARRSSAPRRLYDPSLALSGCVMALALTSAGRAKFASLLCGEGKLN
jgi:hypothetical protein